MPAPFTTLALTLVLTTPAQITPKPGLWQVSSRLTGNGKVFGDNVPPMNSQDKQCITSQLWARSLGIPSMPPHCTILGGKGEKTEHRELNYTCQSAPGHGLRVHVVKDVLSPDIVRVEDTQRMELDGEITTTTNILTYTFLSDSCGDVQPATPQNVPR